MKKTLLLIGFILIFSSGYSQKMDMKWLIGTWKLNTPRGTIVEKWKLINDSTLSGKSVSVKSPGDSVLQETLELKLRKNQWNYISTVQGQNDNRPVSFKLIFLRGSEFISENPAHDYPQRIAYRRIKNTMYASIEGKNNGHYSKQNFDFTTE